MDMHQKSEFDSKPLRLDFEPRSLGTVLLIDDEEIIRELGTRILKKSGYDVITAGDGPEGIMAYRKNRTNIDVTILDLSMPGMDGMQTMQKLKEEFPEAKVMISTGHSLDSDVDRLLAEGFCDVLLKPYKANELTRKVASALKK